MITYAYANMFDACVNKPIKIVQRGHKVFDLSSFWNIL